MLMLRHRKQALTALATIALGMATANASSATILNGSFETLPDFTSWTTIGNATAQSTDFKTPIDGDLQGVISSGNSTLGGSPASLNIASLDTFFNLTAGTLEAQNVKGGSGAKQTFSGVAGDTVTFSYDFVTNEGSNPDFSFYTLAFPAGGSVLVKLGTPTFAGLVASNPLDDLNGYFVRETGYQSGTFTLPSTGTYTLAFGAVNAGDTTLPTGLVLDNVVQSSSTAVPLPTAVYPMTIALAAMAVVCNKLNRQRPRQAVAAGNGTMPWI